MFATGAFILVMVSFIMLYYASHKDKQRRVLNSRLHRHTQIDNELHLLDSSQVSAAQLVAHTISKVGTSLKLIDEETGSEIDLKLIRAGYRKASARATFLGCRLGLFAAGIILALLAHSAFPIPGRLHFLILLYLVPAALGYYLPVMALDYLAKRRQTNILHSLPDALDMLVVCVESGMGLDQAIYKISEELHAGHPELSDEFKQMNLELQAGKARADALKRLSSRIGLLEVSNLATLIIQSDIFGTSMAQSLRTYSDSMRTQRFQRAEEIAMKLPVKLLFPLVLFILPPLFIIIMGPAVVQISRIFGK